MAKYEYEVHRIDENGNTTFRAEEGKHQQFESKKVGPKDVLRIEENDSEILIYLVSGPIYYLSKRKYDNTQVKRDLKYR